MRQLFLVDITACSVYEIVHQLKDPVTMRLVINPGSPRSRDVELQRGTNRFGRSPANDFTIDDPSVSSFHAEIEVGDGSAVIKDLGSTNGTLVHGVRVQEVSLQPGETFRLGGVEMLLRLDNSEPVRMAFAETMQAGQALRQETETQLFPEPIPPEPACLVKEPETAATDKPIFCKNHYQNPGLYRCPRCQRFFCDLCVNTRGSSSGGLKFCKVCGVECARMSVLAHVPKTINFFKAVPDAFKYPFVGDGVMLL